jgi:type I restriction enzyme S subunit
MLWDGERSGLCATGLRGAIGSTVVRLRPKQNVVSRFLYHQLTRHFAWIQARRTGTGVPHVPKDLPDILWLPIPDDVAEQSRIARVLDTVDEAIEKTEAVIAKLKQVRAGLLHDLLIRGLDKHGQIRDPIAHPEQFKDSLIGRIPKEWKVEQLGKRLQQNSGFVQTGPFGSQLHAREYTDDGVPVIMPQDIIEGRITDENIARIPETKAEELRRHRVECGDLVFARRGDLGRCTVVTEKEVGWLCGTGCLLMRFKHNNLVPQWLSRVYRHDIGQRQIVSLAVGTTMVNLNSQILHNLTFAFPEKWEQEAIIRCLNEADMVINAEVNQLEKLTILKSGLMADLLTGRVRVPETIAEVVP